MLHNKIRTKNIEDYFNKNTIDFPSHFSPDDIYNSMYPILTIDQLDNYVNLNNNNINDISDLFEVNSILNKSNKKNCISITFFCQYSNNSFPYQHGTIDFNDTSTNWYKKYVVSLFNFIKSFSKSKYFSTFFIRIYLENQLKSFIPLLLKYDLEIYHMKNNSIGLCPGALWRYLVFDDKNIDIAFSCDIDEQFYIYIKYIDSFINSDKTLGRYFQNYHNFNIINNTAVNYAVVLGGVIGFRPKNNDLNFKSVIINYIIYRMLRSKTDYPNLDKDSDLQTIYNKPVNDHIYGFGGHWFMYGFDEKIWKHIFFPHFVKLGKVLSWSSSNKYNFFHKHPASIDYNFCKFYNNEFIQ
jgi:hypothetical protein